MFQTKLAPRGLFWLCLVVVTTVGLFVSFYNFSVGSLKNWDEGIYALISNEVMQKHSATLFLNGTPWSEKPPLGFYAEAVSIGAFGFSEFGIRFPAAVCLFFSIIALFFLARELWRDDIKSLAATLVAALSPVVIMQHMGRGGDLETGFLLFLILSFLFFWRSFRNPRFLYAAGLAAGLAFMWRGSIGIFVVLIECLFLIATKQWRRFSWYNYLGYIGIFLLTVLPWHIYQLILYGQEFWNVYFGEQFFSRIVAPLQNHAGPWWYYFSFLFEREKFVQVLVALAVIWTVVQITRKREPKQIFLLIWVMVFFVPLVLMKTKLYWYLLGVLPGLYFIFVDFVFYFLAKLKSAWRYGVAALLLVILLYYWHSTWIFVTVPAHDPLPAIAEHLSLSAPANHILFYRTQLWYNGWIFPQVDYYFRYKHNLDIGWAGAADELAKMDARRFGYIITEDRYLAELGGWLDKNHGMVVATAPYGMFRLLTIAYE